MKRCLRQMLSVTLSLAMIIGVFMVNTSRAEAANDVKAGYWEFVSTVTTDPINTQNHSHTAGFDASTKTAICTHKSVVGNDWVKFQGICEFPGEKLLGGDILKINMSLDIAEQYIKDGSYHDDTCNLTATLVDVGSDVWGYTGDNIQFENIDGSKNRDVKCSAHKDPVDPSNKGANTIDSKTLWIKVPRPTFNSQEMIIWFRNLGTGGQGEKGGCMGWKYAWVPGVQRTPTPEGTYVRDNQNTAPVGAWVLKSFEIHKYNPQNSKDTESYVMFYDEGSGLVTAGYRNVFGNTVFDWGFYECMCSTPAKVVTAGSDMSVYVSAESVGGHGYCTSGQAAISGMKNAKSFEDFGFSSFKGEGANPATAISVKEGVYYNAYTTCDLFTKLEGSRSYTMPSGKAGDTYMVKFGFYRGDTICWNYEWVD